MDEYREQRISANLLTEDPDLSKFQNDNGSINEKIRSSYFSIIRRRGFAYSVSLNDEIVGYYMLKVVSISPEDDEIYDDSDSPEYAAIFLDYIVVDTRFRKSGIGSNILKGIISFTKTVINQLPIRFLALKALQERKEWYEKHGFRAIEDSDSPIMLIDFLDKSEIDKYFR